MPKFLKVKQNDDVLVALERIPAGTRIEGVEALSDIPQGHKLALRKIERGSAVMKYSTPIGVATQDIPPGAHVHLHNLGFDDSMLSRTPEMAIERPQLPPVPKWAEAATFKGYRRANGSVGTANVIALISTVNCSATVTQRAADILRAELSQYPNVDDIVAITHGTGCGVAVNSPQHRQDARCLANIADHPNVNRAFYIGLGCEVGLFRDAGQQNLIPIESLLERDRPERSIDWVTIQDAGGSEAAVERIVSRVKKWLPEADKCRRAPEPVSGLILGMNCGGSDAFSGLTANPLLGRLSDLLASLGATSVLAETTETWGAHIPILRRAKDREVGERFLSFFRWWERYMQAFSTLEDFPYTVDGNPSDGNKKGGITTIVEKSLGAATKGGSTMLNAAYDYGERVQPHSGFTFMNTPGLDQVSVTGLLCGGCNLIAFTTGRGSCLGTVIAPTYKIATNSDLFRRMPGDMDFDAGRILDGADSDELLQELFFDLLKVAGGEKQTQSQRLGYGRHEFQIWNIGPTY
jgi:altronate hydrolase